MRKRKSLKFTYDEKWCSPPNWPQQLAGMASYLRAFKATDAAREEVMALVPLFQFSIAILTEPEIESASDERWQQICALASHLECVIFTPGALLDPHGRALIATDGRMNADARIP